MLRIVICFASFGRFSAERASICGIVLVQRSSEKPQWGRGREGTGGWATAASKNNAVQQRLLQTGYCACSNWNLREGVLVVSIWWDPWLSIRALLLPHGISKMQPAARQPWPRRTWICIHRHTHITSRQNHYCRQEEPGFPPCFLRPTTCEEESTLSLLMTPDRLSQQVVWWGSR